MRDFNVNEIWYVYSMGSKLSDRDNSWQRFTVQNNF